MNENREDCALRVEVSLQTTTWLTSHANDFGNAKRRARENPQRVGKEDWLSKKSISITLYYIMLHTIFSLSVWKIVSGMSKKSTAKVWSGYPRNMSVLIFAEVVFNVSYQRIADLIYTSLFRRRIGKFPFLSHFCIFCPRSLVLSNFIVKRRRVNQI